MKNVSLGELALELKINKSRLAFYYESGLLVPVETVGRMNVFNYDKAVVTLKKIKELQKKGKKLKEIKTILVS